MAILSPIVAILMSIPMIMASKAEKKDYILIFCVVSGIVLLAGILQLLMLHLFQNSKYKRWIQLLLPSFMMSMGFYISSFIYIPEFARSIDNFTAIRIVNTISINFIFFIFVDLIATRESKNLLELNHMKLKALHWEAEYQVLENKMNPHFLLNTLEAIRYLSSRDITQLDYYLTSLSNFIQTGITQKNKHSSVKEELFLLSNYIELQKVRFPDQIVLKISIPEEKLGNFLPHFSFVTLAENAIKHNSFSITNPLVIEIGDEDGRIYVRNNRRGKITQMPSTQTGLKNLSDRCRDLSGSPIEIEQTKEFYTVKIKLLQEI